MILDLHFQISLADIIMTNFKILYSIGSLSSKGGTERVLSTKASIFAEKYGIEIHICTQSKNTKRAYQFSDKIHFHDLYNPSLIPNLKIPFYTNWIYKKRFYENFKALLDEIRPNVVIVMERGTDDFYLPEICHQLKIPIVREFHFAKGAVWERAKIMKSMFQRMKYLITYLRIFCSFNNYDYLVLLTKKDQESGNYKTPTVVIPNIVDAHLIEHGNYSNKVAISVGSMNDNRKGFLDLIRMWRDVANFDPEWRLDIYGTGSQKELLQKEINKLGLSRQVKLCGLVSDIESKYCQSAIYLSASVAEGLPMVIIEAMSCGLSCISYDCPTGPSDIITESQDGFLIPLHDSDQFFRVFKKIALNPKKLESMGKCAKLKSEQFRSERIIPMWLDFFEKFGYGRSEK